MFGHLGVLKQINDKAQCHICGKTFGHLGGHIVRSHQMSADDYKSEFGLKQGTGLIGNALQAKRRLNVDHLSQYHDAGLTFLKSLTFEERSLNAKNRDMRAEERIHPQFTANRKRAAKISGIKSRKIAEANAVYEPCFNCGKTFKLRSGQSKFDKRYCSKDCYINCPVRIKQGAIMCRDQNMKVKGRPHKHVRRCKQCNTLFRSRLSVSQFCGANCYQQSDVLKANLKQYR